MLKNSWNWLKEMLESAHRVIIIAKRPSREKFTQVVMVTGASMVLIGGVGVIIKFSTILIKNALK